MKKVTNYSLLFAFLVGMSPLPVKADAPKALSLTGAIGLAMVSYGSFVFGFENFKDSRTYSGHAEQTEQESPSQSASYKESVRQSFITEQNKYQNYGRILQVLGMASLLGAGFLAYKSLK